MAGVELAELDELFRIVERGAGLLEVRTECEVERAGRRFPLVSVCFGSKAADAPAVGFVAGVHGLERVGTHVVLHFLTQLVARLRWDETLQRQVANMRFAFLPLVNPAGMSARTRCNANGVDLMRNAPVEASERVAFLVGGQRLTSRLPWYRGAAGAPMEPESEALCAFVRRELLSRPFSIALDCHSGFGMTDRIWFPHARTRKPFAHLAEVHALSRMFTASYAKVPYIFEPQCRQYLTHGDLWDYLAEIAPSEAIFLPLTLEMGSWRWIRKHPRQLFSRMGIFNPLPPDRLRRVRRNHMLWLGFLCRAAVSWGEWAPSGAERDRHESEALAAWFEGAA
jgi:hypothetical protein